MLGTSFDALDIGLPVRNLRDAITDVQSQRELQAEQLVEGLDRRGKRILCRVRVTALLNEANIQHGLVLVFQDVTEERTQEEYGRYLGRIMGQALNEIYFLDPETLRFRLSNKGAQRKLGYTAEKRYRFFPTGCAAAAQR